MLLNYAKFHEAKGLEAFFAAHGYRKSSQEAYRKTAAVSLSTECNIDTFSDLYAY